MADDGQRADDVAGLRARLAEAALAARVAHRDTTRLIRLLAAIGQPVPSARLVAEVLHVLSDVFAADVTWLARADDVEHRVEEACGSPQGAPGRDAIWTLPADVAAAIAADRPTILPAGTPGTDDPPLVRGLGPGSVAILPLGGAAGDRILGLFRRAPGGFEQLDLDVVHSIGARLRSSLERREQRESLARLVHAGHRLAGQPDPERLADAAAELLATLAGADAAWVVLVEDGVSRVAARRGACACGPGHWEGRVEHLPALAAALDGQPESRVAACGQGGRTVRLAVPALAEGTLVAVLVAERRAPFRFRQDVVETLSVLGLHLTAALRNLRLYRALRDRESSLRLITDAITDLVAVVDGRGMLSFASPSHLRQLGHDPADLVGRPLAELVHPEDRGRLAAALGTDSGAPVECRLRRADGTWIWGESAARAVDGSTVVSTRVVDERRRLEDELRRRATHDALTGLANRTLLSERLAAALAGEAATGAPEVGLLFCDLDRFKDVNDRMGHDAGDRLLVAVARRLRETVRPTDLVGRLGGDEFVVILPEVRGLAGVEVVGQRLLAALRRPYDVDGTGEVMVSASIGGVAARRGRASALDLLRDADAAMYAAKGAGRDQLELFDEDDAARSRDRSDLRGDLERAVARGELEVHYQPIVDLATGRPLAVEALVRWRHPVRGLVPPDAFVPIAEETGAILGIGRHVAATALDQLVAWRRLPGLADLELHVNVSPYELADDALVPRLAEALARRGLPASALWIEVTERGDVPDQACRTATAARRAGVRVALDDFGVSSSNLELLRRLEPDCVKIDRSFVRGLSTGAATDQAIVGAILAMAGRLGLGAVAEGVEHEVERERLLALGCVRGQGYLIARPAAAPGATAFLAGATGGQRAG